VHKGFVTGHRHERMGGASRRIDGVQMLQGEQAVHLAGMLHVGQRRAVEPRRVAGHAQPSARCAGPAVHSRVAHGVMAEGPADMPLPVAPGRCGFVAPLIPKRPGALRPPDLRRLERFQPCAPLRGFGCVRFSQTQLECLFRFRARGFDKTAAPRCFHIVRMRLAHDRDQLERPRGRAGKQHIRGHLDRHTSGEPVWLTAAVMPPVGAKTAGCEPEQQCDARHRQRQQDRQGGPAAEQQIQHQQNGDAGAVAKQHDVATRGPHHRRQQQQLGERGVVAPFDQALGKQIEKNRGCKQRQADREQDHATRGAGQRQKDPLRGHGPMQQPDPARRRAQRAELVDGEQQGTRQIDRERHALDRQIRIEEIDQRVQRQHGQQMHAREDQRGFAEAAPFA
jgi:hypothetical protein